MALACSRAKSPETAKKTTSHSRAAFTSNGSTTTSPYLDVATVVPALRSLPKMRNLETGKSRVSKHVRISFPTAPVAPTIPTVYDDDDMDNDVVVVDDAVPMLLRKLVDGVCGRFPWKLNAAVLPLPVVAEDMTRGLLRDDTKAVEAGVKAETEDDVTATAAASVQEVNFMKEFPQKKTTLRE